MLQLFAVPKNLESGTGPSLSLSLLECLALDLCLLSFFDFLDLDFDLDLFNSLSSSLLEDSEDELAELDSDDLRLCCKIHFKYKGSVGRGHSVGLKIIQKDKAEISGSVYVRQ